MTTAAAVRRTVAEMRKQNVIDPDGPIMFGPERVKAMRRTADRVARRVADPSRRVAPGVKIPRHPKHAGGPDNIYPFFARVPNVGFPVDRGNPVSYCRRMREFVRTVPLDHPKCGLIRHVVVMNLHEARACGWPV